MKFWKNFKSASGQQQQQQQQQSMDKANNNGKKKDSMGKSGRSRFGRSNGGGLINRLSNGGGGSGNGHAATGNNNADYGEESIYEDFGGLTNGSSRRSSLSPSASASSLASNGGGGGPNSMGTTFVELIKRPGTKLGVSVSSSPGDTSSSAASITALTPGSWAQRSDVLCVGDAVVGVNGVATDEMEPGQLAETLDCADRVQLEVRYPLPPYPPSRLRFTSRAIQVRLQKENGSFGMVIRGGSHEIHRRRRPFTVVHVTEGGPAFRDGVVRVNDRVRSVNGVDLRNLRLPELQSLLYRQDGETVFTVEYDVAQHELIEQGPVLVEIRRDRSDPFLGFGLNKCADSGHIFVESLKQASLAERCGAIHVGDILLSVNGRGVTGLGADEATRMVTEDAGSTEQSVLQLEMLPGIYSRTQANLFRSSMPASPSFSSLRGRGGHHHNGSSSSSTIINRHNSMTDIDRPASFGSNGSHFNTVGRRTANGSLRQGLRQQQQQPEQRRKYVTFTVELQRDGGPLGLTLATETDASSPGPIYISALMQDGLAERTRTVQVNDQLVEINGREVKELCLNQVIPMLQECSSEVIRLKLARLINIPERDAYSAATLRRQQSGAGAGAVSRAEALNSNYGLVTPMPSAQTPNCARKPPLPSPPVIPPSSSSRLPLHQVLPAASARSSRRDSSTSSVTSAAGHHHQGQGHHVYGGQSSPTPSLNGGSGGLNTVSLLPAPNGLGGRPMPMEVHKVTLFKDKVYEDFGFSVSDGLYERGIFVNRIRKAGPADASGLLRPLDRILQINDTRTTDFDCCLAVPLIAAAGDKIELLVARTNRVFLLARNSAGSLDGYSDDLNHQHHQQQHQQQQQQQQVATMGRDRRSAASSSRLSRTSSADGRLTALDSCFEQQQQQGSVTWEVAPWARLQQQQHPGDEAL